MFVGSFSHALWVWSLSIYPSARRRRSAPAWRWLSSEARSARLWRRKEKTQSCSQDKLVPHETWPFDGEAAAGGVRGRRKEGARGWEVKGWEEAEGSGGREGERERGKKDGEKRGKQRKREGESEESERSGRAAAASSVGSNSVLQALQRQQQQHAQDTPRTDVRVAQQQSTGALEDAGVEVASGGGVTSAVFFSFSSSFPRT
mmetsp:Transcript_23617/g.43853  ORF Transcript_23617/g.43853 Transcript_23617/m.43853 type:complete len:203 (-) Transcript_23617:357-965(-)